MVDEFDHDDVDRFLERIWLAAKPGSLLLDAWVAYRCQGVIRYCSQTLITPLINPSNKPAAERNAAYMAWFKRSLEAHEGFEAIKAHYRLLKVTCAYATVSPNAGTIGEVWSVTVPESELPHLERLAQERAGYCSQKDREAASEAFRMYVARNFETNFEKNRLRLPEVGVSPY